MSEPTTVTKTAPERIWLQHSDEEHGGISWCHEQVFMGDVEYIRKDLYAALKRQRDMLLEALKPFANEANKYDPDEGDSSQRIWDTTLMIGHLREAREAIAAVEEEK